MATSNTYQLISADSHVIEPPDLFEKRLPTRLRKRAPKLQPWNGGDAWFVEGHEPIPLPVSALTGSGYRIPTSESSAIPSFANTLPGLHDPKARLQLQDSDSIDAEVLYPSSGLWDALKRVDDAELKVACVSAYNDWIAEFCAHAPDRLIGVGKIPTTSPEDALSELSRCVEELNLRGILLDSWPGEDAVVGRLGSAMGSKASIDEAFWSAVNQAHVPVTIHYALGVGASTSFPPGVAAGTQPPMAELAVPVLAAGLFDQFPDVRFVLAHGDAGWAHHWLEFMDMMYLRRRHLEAHRLPFKDPDALPSQYIRRHFWFTFQHDRSAVKNRNFIGPAHLMWSSHFPLDGTNFPDNREQAMHTTDGVPDEERHALLVANVARLYRLRGYEHGFDDSEIGNFADLVHY